MTNTATKLKRALCSMVVMLAHIGRAFPLYRPMRHRPASIPQPQPPITSIPLPGIIEDSGGEGSYVLGQSMTDSALNKSALVEVDSSGATWVTIRLNLMDNIQSPQFQVDGSRNGSFPLFPPR